MLASIFPLAHTRYSSLPILGGIWEGLCSWLSRQGYPIAAIRRRVRAGPQLEEALCGRDVRFLGDLTASQLRSLAPLPTHWNAQITGSLVRSLTQYLEEQGALASPPITPTVEQTAAYRKYMERVRGLAPSTAVREVRRVCEFLQFLDYDAPPSDFGNCRLPMWMGSSRRRDGGSAGQACRRSRRRFDPSSGFWQRKDGGHQVSTRRSTLRAASAESAFPAPFPGRRSDHCCAPPTVRHRRDDETMPCSC